MKNNQPNYKVIFEDIIAKKYPKKEKDCRSLLNKKKLTTFNILELNKKIFGTSTESLLINQKHKSYNRCDIVQILIYQRKKNLSNQQISEHFKLSRNTVAKWKKIFQMSSF
ncbi:helix-turn-helix domain-containing protein [Chryseobacterium timonianum]|uniref:helix-turn-helix domain-containing protein n=1 Tax=Chryseobacterium timonianum TaxID=1805473 RepID=UPI00083A1E7D|nr:helix-turn-helix domain-containing protein [Chryseobacterium timonianum]